MSNQKFTTDSSRIDAMTQEWTKDCTNIKYNDNSESGDAWWLCAIRERDEMNHSCEYDKDCTSDECSLGLHYGPYSYANLCSLDGDLYDPYFDQKTTYFYKLERNKDGTVVPIYLRDINT